MSEEAILISESEKGAESSGGHVKVKGGNEDIQFFGEIERHPKGGFRSEYPAWALPRQLTDLKEELRQKQEALENPGIPNRQELKTKVNELKAKINDIESSKPKFNSKQKDFIAKAAYELGLEITRSYPKRSDIMRGIVDPHEEVRRDTEPCVKIPTEFRGLVSACGVNMKNGMACRDAAVKGWKIMRRSLSEPSHSEILRNQD